MLLYPVVKVLESLLLSSFKDRAFCEIALGIADVLKSVRSHKRTIAIALDKAFDMTCLVTKDGNPMLSLAVPEETS